ncbi:MAG: exopolyphosphatase [Planctomycetaceae bacterium]|nr:exopolyphosphatase [Planctomycetaceae bacterium]
MSKSTTSEVSNLTLHRGSGDPNPAGPYLAAVIDIGATSLRMAIGEVNSEGRLRIVDNVKLPVSLGIDTFTVGRIEKKTATAMVRALLSCRKKLHEFGLKDMASVRVVATSAVREARNRVEFIDQVFNLTGMEIEPIDEADVHRVTYLEVLGVFDEHPELCQGRTLAIEIGGGSTEVIVLQDGEVIFSNTFRMGSLRMRRTLEGFRTSGERIREIMESEVARVGDRLVAAIGADQIDRMLVMGGDMRLAADLLYPNRETSDVEVVDVQDLEKLFEEVWSTSTDQLVGRHQLSIADAESFAPALMAYTDLAHRFNLKNFHVTDTNLREGLLLDMAGMGRSAKIRPQILASVRAVAQKYGVDEKHAAQVSHLSEQIFGVLASDYGLTENCQLILQVAAWLHEIGMFVNVRSYHKHSLYLIRSSEFFGISAKNLLLAALVARYHRRAVPQPTHEFYNTLDRRDRATVCKLAAILRVAKALDVSRNGRVAGFEANRTTTKLVLNVFNVSDLTMEGLELQYSGSMFEETFGLKLVLTTGN